MEPTITKDSIVVWAVRGEYPKGSLAGAKHFLAHGVAGLGWPDMGDLQKLSPDFKSFRQKLDDDNPPEPDWCGAERNSYLGKSASKLYRWVHEVSVGDPIVLATNLDGNIHIGTVSGPYQHCPRSLNHYTHQRKVEWHGSAVWDALSEKSRRALSTLRTIITNTAGNP